MKIVVLDGYTLNPGDNPWDEVAAMGELTVYDRTPRDLVVERAADAEVLLTNKTPVNRQALEGLASLRYISVLATGYDVVDVRAAAERAIPVSNVPEYGTQAVAQCVFALLLELCHHPGLHDAAVRAGEWQRSGDYSFWKTPLVELAGKTLAVVGFGRIGRRVAELGHAFGMSVLAVDPSRREAPPYRPFAWALLEEAVEQADVITLNCSLTPDNEGMVNRALLARMRPGAYLINSARGQLVREADLAAALNAGALAGAALDVVTQEPITPDNPLLKARNCILTPHIAWAALEARRRLMHTTAENIRSYVRGQVQNRVE